VPPGNSLEAWDRDGQAQYSIRINDQWRLCFVWRDGAAWDVEVADHREGASMSIKREDIDRRNVDFSDVRSGRRLPPVHPGEILRDAFLTPMGISVYALAHAIKVPRSRANDIVRGRRALTTDSAIRLGRYFGMTPEF
jgi:addiction module HigA family antidote